MDLFKFVLRLNGFNLKKAVLNLERSKGLQIQRRDEIVEYHKKNNPLYKSLLAGKEINKFEDLPVVTKVNFQKPLKDIVSTSYELDDLYIANTSGSSGHPFFYVKNKDSHAIIHALFFKLYTQQGITTAMKQARFYGIPSSGITRYKELLKDYLSNRVRFPIFDLSDENLDKYLTRFKRIRFGYIYGYTSAITLFAKYLIRKNIILKDVCPSLKACIVTSEVCTAEDRTILSKALGVKIINEYGCSETGLIAFENPDGVWRMVEEDSYFEVVDSLGKPLPCGEEGRILITSLSNKAMPFIRYEIGDMGVFDKDQEGLILRKLCGRVSDVVRLPSGKIAGGLAFYYVSRSIMEQTDIVREFIVRQTRLDTFIFDMVTSRDLTTKELASLQKKLDEYLEPGLILIINRVKKIDRPGSGKIKHFYSQLQ